MVNDSRSKVSLTLTEFWNSRRYIQRHSKLTYFYYPSFHRQLYYYFGANEAACMMEGGIKHLQEVHHCVLPLAARIWKNAFLINPWNDFYSTSLLANASPAPPPRTQRNRLHSLPNNSLGGACLLFNYFSESMVRRSIAISVSQSLFIFGRTFTSSGTFSILTDLTKMALRVISIKRRAYIYNF